MEGIEDSEIRNHLRSIPLVNGHLLEQKEQTLRNQRNWFICASLFCILGLTTLAMGFMGMNTPIFTYDYGSEEIVPTGVNGESFISLEAFIDQEYVAVHSEIRDSDIPRGSVRDEALNFAYDKLKAKYASLSTPAYLVTGEYKGLSFIEAITDGQDLINLQASGKELGGSRTYNLYNTRTEIREEFRYVNIGGIFLLALGIFGFILERLLSRKR